MKTLSLIMSFLTFLSLTTSLTGCGGIGGMNLPVNQGSSSSGDNLPIENGGSTLSTILGTPIAKDLYAVAINKIVITQDEESGNKFLQIRSMGGTSSSGAFYGSGIGNKGLIGIGGDSFAGKLVSEFQSIKFKTRELASNPAGSYNLYLNMLVDLNCNENNPDYTLIVADQTSTPGAKGSWYSFQINTTDAAFQSIGGKGGLPSQFDPSHANLSALVAAHPTACFVAADVFDNGMKRHQKLSPFLLVHGDSAYNKASVVQVDDIELTVGTQTLLFSF